MGNAAIPIACTTGGAALGGQLGAWGGMRVGADLGEAVYGLRQGITGAAGDVDRYKNVCKGFAVLGGDLVLLLQAVPQDL